jgi:peroxiredoxin
MPDFRLPAAEGRSIRTSDYHNSLSLVLVFVGEYNPTTSFGLLSDLAGHYTEIKAGSAEVLAVLRGTPAQAASLKQHDNLPFPVLADEDGQVHRDYGAMSQDGRSTSRGVYVAGRFGKVYLSSRASDGPPLPTVDGLLGSLRFIEAQCPECGQDEALV